MPRYDSKRKTARDNKIREYVKQHPDFSQQEIADHHGLSRSNIARILGKGRCKVSEDGK